MDQMSEQTNNQENNKSVVADNSIINSANTTVQDVITFNDTDIVQETSSSFVDTVHIDRWRLNDVRDLMSRPFRNLEFKYNVTWAPGLARYINPANQIRNGSFADYMRKYCTMNATICCQARVNAQPFQTGAFQLAYIPPGLCAKAQPGNVDFYIPEINTFQNDQLESIPFISGLPFSQLNKLPTATTSVIKVPFKWTTDVNSLGALNLGIFVFQPIQSLGSKIAADFAQVIIYTWLEDLEVEGASGYTYNSFTENPLPALRDAVSLQAKTKAEEATTVSSVASKVSNVAGMLSKIPFVSDVAGPVSIAADMTSKVASMFGFSKPFTQEPVTNINIHKPFGHVKVDGVFAGTKMTVNRNQEIPTHAMGYVADDEMTMSYVIQKPCIWSGFKWAIGDEAEAQLMSTRISTGLFASPIVVPGSSVVGQANTYLSYLSGIFKFFRGPIKIKFTVVANSFYSGRFRVIYEPRAPIGSSPNDTNIQSVLNLTEIYDIKDAQEFEFTIPWVIENDWLSTAVNTQSTNVQYDLGRLSIWVEKKLRTNAQCPDAIAVWMYVYGTEETEFCVPRSLTNIFPNTAGQPPVVREPISLQGKFDQSIQSIGDPSLSLRPLLKRYEVVSDLIPANVYRNPWNINAGDKTLFNWITRMYVHQTGSIRFWVPGHEGIFVVLGMSDPGYEEFPNHFLDNVTPVTNLYYNTDDMLDVEIPYYNIYPRINMQSARFVTQDATHVNYTLTVSRCMPPTGIAFSEDVIPYRAAGDDFNCGMLMGPRWTTQFGNYAHDPGSIPPGLTPLG